MSYQFPSREWLRALEEKLNNDQQYAKIAKNWEGDLSFLIEFDEALIEFDEALIEADETLTEPIVMYIDLWHGKCRGVEYYDEGTAEKEAAFILSASFGNFERVLEGELNPMQAMMTRKLKVSGNFAYMMRNVPIVLDFVRCCQEIT